MSEIEKLNMIAEWQEQHKQLIEDLDNSKKRITDLEKENTELRKELNYANTHCLFHSDCPTQKENSELKEKLNFSTQYYQGEKAREQLTNAKEIIKGLLSFVDSLGNYSGGIFAKAEQFLNENSTYERIQESKI